MVKELVKSNFFWIGLILKVASLFFFETAPPKDLFLPFLDRAILNSGVNPWTLSEPRNFPYGSFLFLVLFLPKQMGYWLFGDLALGTTPLSLFLLKFPLLIFDLIILKICWSISAEHRRRLLTYYWLNPIQFFVSYYYGQLDIVSISLCMASLYFLIQKKEYTSGILMAFATLSKFHIVAIVPFCIFYIWNGEFRKPALVKVTKWLTTWTIICGLGFLPLFSAHQFGYVTTGSPEFLRLFGTQINIGNEATVYLGILFSLLVLGRLTLSSHISDQALFFGVSAIFSSLIIVTLPSPGWYNWVAPFFSLLMVLYMNVPKTLFWAFNGVYLVVYGALPHFGQNSGLISNISFSILQATLIAFFITLWRVVLNRQAPIYRRLSPYKIGIAGNSGAGKSFLSQILADTFDRKRSQIIEGDNYHRWERLDSNWSKFTHLNPIANNLNVLSRHLKTISDGASFYNPVYCHGSGVFSAPIEFKPFNTVVVEGLHTFFLEDMRKSLDLKIFVKPDSKIEMAWRIIRDTAERGHDIENILKSIESRGQDAQKYIMPQANFADLVIEYNSDSSFKFDEMLKRNLPSFSVAYILRNNMNLSKFASVIEKTFAAELHLEVLENNIDRIKLKISGLPSAKQVQAAAEKLFPKLRQITRGSAPPIWHPGQSGIHQLVLLQLISSEKEKYDSNYITSS